ncbi:competence protein TfoX [Thioclava sp. BHET1]|uniref:Competence protein TfoX n=1 Tax=Thioclava dalianensis TaxID=1185766 RepID=A0A074TIU9_9RHOB|nr:TfoX/Sxy family DNA transformation protein [Thioclava dalianensis]KEP71636.1 competence protein TfoX [Thioclava dalianensis]TMV90152.1 competence protein TfoX [Thioclava sp. BHET1]SFN42468.1 TfoX C-terminal domain-containing protein [Thioclava dalianensis]
MSDITSIPGIGPASAEGFARAGITHADQLREMGAHAAYGAWIAAGNPPHFIGYYALHMALQGRPWNDCRGAEKATLRKSFDALCATARPPEGSADKKGRSRLEAALDEIGLIARR